MKLIYLFILTNLLIFSVNSQPIIVANFGSFSLGKLSGQNGWTNNSSVAGGTGACAGAICTNNTIVNTPISYPAFDNCNYSLAVTGDQDGTGTSFDGLNTGSLYTFMLVSFTTVPAGNNDIIRLMGGNNYSVTSRIYVRNAGGGFYAGIAKGSSTASYGSSPTLLALNTPHLFVLKHTFLPGATDDIVTLFIDPDMSKAEPTSFEVSTSVGTDYSMIDRLTLPFNLSNKPTGNIGEIKLSSAWSDGYSIVGKCITPYGNVINGATVAAIGASTNVTTDITGTYNYKLPAGNYTLKGSKNDDVNKTNGITSLDLALTQSHILGKSAFNSPYKTIAADVNGDGKVTTLDIVYMKRLILGMDTTFNNSTTNEKRLWVFIDSSFSVASLPIPFTLKDSITITNLNANTINQTFLGIKLGDVNWDWNPLIAKQNPSIIQGKR